MGSAAHTIQGLGLWKFCCFRGFTDLGVAIFGRDALKTGLGIQEQLSTFSFEP